MNEGATAVLFYTSAAAFVFGIVRALRASIERQARDRIAVVVAACGFAGLAVSVVAFLHGPRGMLPF